MVSHDTLKDTVEKCVLHRCRAGAFIVKELSPLLLQSWGFYCERIGSLLYCCITGAFIVEDLFCVAIVTSGLLPPVTFYCVHNKLSQIRGCGDVHSECRVRGQRSGVPGQR